MYIIIGSAHILSFPEISNLQRYIFSGEVSNKTDKVLVGPVIRDHLMDMYGLEASTATISRVTDKILPLIQEWRSRPLEWVYPFVWLDSIHYKVRHEGRVVSRAVYCIIGHYLAGYKELLGMYVGEN